MKAFIVSKTVIMLVLTLILIGATAPAIFAASDEFVKRSLELRIEQLAGVINVIQSARSGTSHKFFLPKGDCGVKIDRLSLTLTSNKNSVTKEFVNAAEVLDADIKCNKAESKVIYIKKCGNKIFIDEKSQVCT